MKHITINRAEQADVDAIMQLMQEAVDTVKVSDWFLPDNRQYIEAVSYTHLTLPTNSLV